MIPFFAAERTWAEHGARYTQLMASALATGRALQGPPVPEFEAALAAKVGRRHAVAVGSGTDALGFALLAAGIGPGDEVIVPAMSFIASGSCVLRAGATPVFADVDDQLLLDFATAPLSRRTKAVIAVDLYGQTVDPAAAEDFAREHGLVLIEDAAQALGAAGAGAIGTLSCCSFDPTKTLAAPGSGGAVLTDDDELAERVRRLRWHGRGSGELGFNSQLPSASAAVLLDKLGHDARWTARRREIARRYDEVATPIGAVRDHVFHKYVVRSADREALRGVLEQAGIPTLVHYATPLPHQPLFACGTPFPRAEAACREVLSLPIHAYLTDGEVEHVVATLRRAGAAPQAATRAS